MMDGANHDLAVDIEAASSQWEIPLNQTEAEGIAQELDARGYRGRPHGQMKLDLDKALREAIPYTVPDNVVHRIRRAVLGHLFGPEANTTRRQRNRKPPRSMRQEEKVGA